MRKFMSADSRSRTFPPTRDTSASVVARLSGRLGLVSTETNSCSNSCGVGRLPLALGSLLCRDSRQLCRRIRQASSSASARRTREIIERTMRAMFSARSTYRPSQKTLSATLLGTARSGAAQLHRLAARAQHAERVYGAVPQHPCVLAVAAPLHGDDRPSALGNPDQAAGNGNPSVAGIQHVGAQHDAARDQVSVLPHRRGGQRDPLLRHILVGPGPQLLGKLALARYAAFRRRRPAPSRG